MRFPQFSLPPPLYASHRPERYRFLVRPTASYLIVGGLVCTLIWVGTPRLLPDQFIRILIALGGYLVYLVGKIITVPHQVAFGKDDGWPLRLRGWLEHHTRGVWWLWDPSLVAYRRRGFARTILLLGGLFLVLQPIYWHHTIGGQASIIDNPLWLLFALAVSPTAKRPIFRAFVCSLAMAIAVLAVITVPPLIILDHDGPDVVMGDLVIKVCWLALLTGILHYLARTLSEHQANQALLIRAHALLQTSTPGAVGEEGDDWELLMLPRILELLVDSFPFVAATIWAVHTEGALRPVVTRSGKDTSISLKPLILKGFTLKSGTGLMGQAIRQRRSITQNDVLHDRWYVHHDDLAAVRAEMVVPIYLSPGHKQ